MYDKRLKLFVALAALLLFICLIRLVQMQLLSQSYYRSRIDELQKDKARQLSTIRGTISDCKGRKLAIDEPRFQLCIHYRLTRLMDERFWQVKLLQQSAKGKNRQQPLTELQAEFKDDIEALQDVIYKCVQLFGIEQEEIEKKIQSIDQRIWNLRTFLAWRKNCQDSELLKNYDGNIQSIRLSQAIADFEKKFPTIAQRFLLIDKIDIAEMHTTWPMVDLQTDDDVLAAQLQFINSKWVGIMPHIKRIYPYGPAAAQTIGWVGPAQEPYKLPLANDELLEYRMEELAGRDGIEYLCEGILRGRRGRLTYNFDDQLVERTERQFGQDIQLTLDILLQERIQQYLADCTINVNCASPTAVVVLEVTTGNILSMVSMPSFDLNTIRQRYSQHISDPNIPLLNRAIRRQYPPGSVIKPVILIAGLEANKITPYEVISCPAKFAPSGWPSCWIFQKYRNTCHDDQWNGDNSARNAIKGSCNIYFSRLANRLEGPVLQEWLGRFGYGRKILQGPRPYYESERDFADGTTIQMQLEGVISSPDIPAQPGQLQPIKVSEKRLFGIGQGNLRVTPLQVANAMAVIARGGLYKPPTLFIQDANDPNCSLEADLGINPETMALVRDGMYAVVNEFGGTAYKEFEHSGLAEQDVRVYGKTGSTEMPDHAWFAGFAQDSRGRGIAIAVVVEGGQRGSTDAGPLARDIIQFCIDAGYIGQSSNPSF
jgi:penicillin-binding protein 2